MGKAKNIILTVLSALLVVSVCFNIRQCSTGGEAYQDTIRTTFVDTVQFYKPMLRDSVVVRYITEILPVLHDTCKTDTVNMAYLNGKDSIKVEIPISGKVYEDSTYTAYVSGYRASLDSIFVYPRREVVRIKERSKPKRWGIGIQAGYGVGSDGFSPYFGIGLSYNLFDF